MKVTTLTKSYWTSSFLNKQRLGGGETLSPFLIFHEYFNGWNIHSKKIIPTFFIRSKKMKPTMRERFQGCLVGVGIGDAMGMPVETMTPHAIMEVTDNKGIETFEGSIGVPFRGMEDLPAGTCTDDWQLTSAIARSIIRCGGIDQNDIAFEHVIEINKSNLGFGKSTKGAIYELEKYFRTIGKEGRPPFSKAVKGGCGNGVAMKIQPIGLYFSHVNHSKRDVILWDVVAILGQMTHPDIRASVSAYVLAELLVRIINEPIQNISTPDYQVYVRDLLKDLIAQAQRVEATEKCDEKPFSEYVAKILEIDLSDPIEVRESLGTGCFAMESVTFAIATFLRNPTDFSKGVLEAVNAGGDTDTNASMVGGLIGANVGINSIPEKWRTFEDRFIEQHLLGKALYEIDFSE